MADKKISALTGATTPLAGTEVLPIVQSGSTVKVAVSDLTAGRAVAASTLALSGGAAVGGATLDNSVGRLIVDSSGFSYAITATANDQSAARIRVQNTGSGGGDYALVSGEVNVGNTGFTVFRVGVGTILALDDGSGNTVIKNGNFVIGTSGKGIDFSATPGTGTSELLNDYEEGTFTATLTASTTAPTTPVTVTAYYTVVGRLVTVQVGFFNVDTTGAVGSVEITGMPFTAASTFSVGSAAVDFGASSPVSFINSGATKILLYASNTLGGIPIVASAGRYVVASISYLK